MALLKLARHRLAARLLIALLLQARHLPAARLLVILLPLARHLLAARLLTEVRRSHPSKNVLLRVYSPKGRLLVNCTCPQKDTRLMS